MAVKGGRRRAAQLSASLALVLVGCATSSETRNAPEAAPASATSPLPSSEPAPAPAAPAAGNPSGKADDADFATLAEAEAALDRAHAELNRVAMLDRGPRDFATAPAAAAPPAPKARAKRGTESAGEESREESRAQKAGRAAAKPPPLESRADAEAAADPCEVGCKAFASLMRAKAAVCRLDTPGGTRCSRAENIAREAEVRVRSCGCQP